MDYRPRFVIYNAGTPHCTLSDVGSDSGGRVRMSDFTKEAFSMVNIIYYWNRK